MIWKENVGDYLENLVMKLRQNMKYQFPGLPKICDWKKLDRLCNSLKLIFHRVQIKVNI